MLNLIEINLNDVVQCVFTSIMYCASQITFDRTPMINMHSWP